MTDQLDPHCCTPLTLSIGACLSKSSSLIFPKLSQHLENVWKTSTFLCSCELSVAGYRVTFQTPSVNAVVTTKSLPFHHPFQRILRLSEPSDHCQTVHPSTSLSTVSILTSADLSMAVPTSPNLRPRAGAMNMAGLNPELRVSKVVSFIWRLPNPQFFLTLMDSKQKNRSSS